jgi:hypothetical protein
VKSKTLALGTASFFLASLGFLVVGCASSSGSDSGDEQVGGTQAEPIVNGKSADQYQEAALIDTQTFACSGSVIAPRVVLTAGHCVSGADAWRVTTPFAGNQQAMGHKIWTEYKMIGETVNPDTVDVGIIILDTPIQLSSYPKLSTSPVADGTKAVNVGRIRNGQLSDSGLYYGKQVSLSDGSQDGFQYSYVSSEIIESGDSGGPVYVGDGKNRQIVAVNSGAGGGTQILARVDLVMDHIQQIIAQNGGSGGGGSSSSSSSSGGTSSGGSSSGGTSGGSSSGGSSGGSSSGGSSGGTSSGGSSSGSSGGAFTCNNTAEDEPNDFPEDAELITGQRCGTLTPGDQDWFTWSASRAGLVYDIELTATGDAELEMWKDTGDGYQQIVNKSPTAFNASTNGRGTYVFVVASPTDSAQAYHLGFKK